MKLDRSIDSLHERIDEIESKAAVAANDDHDTYRIDKYDDEYYLSIGQDPPRFKYYRQARAEKWNAQSHKPSDTDPSITLDEIEYGLKRVLRVPREQRYQREKSHWYWHDSSYNNRGLEAYDGYGCHDGQCIPECKYFPDSGVIEDEQVKEDFRKVIEYYRQRNVIVEPPSKSELLEMAKKEMV